MKFKTLLLGAWAVILVSIVSFFISSTFVLSCQYYTRPTIFQSIPIEFQDKGYCKDIQRLVHTTHEREKLQAFYSEECYPSATIDLVSEQKSLIQEGQDYSVLLALKIPESPHNFDLGNFLVTLEVDGEPDDTNGNTMPQNIASSKMMSLKYTSPFKKFIHSAIFWPWYFFSEDVQTLETIMFQKLHLPNMGLKWRGTLTVDKPDILISSGILNFTAQFEGLYYLFYKWPLLSFVVAVSVCFVPVASTLLALTFLIFRGYSNSAEEEKED